MGHAISNPSVKKPIVVNKLLVKRFVGKWFEIGRYKNDSELKYNFVEVCFYEHKNLLSHIVKTHLDTKHNIVVEHKGAITNHDCSGNIHFEFETNDGSKIYSDHIVLMTDYTRYAVLGDDNRNQLWILSRTPSMSACLYDALSTQLFALFQYDMTKVVFVENAIAECV